MYFVLSTYSRRWDRATRGHTRRHQLWIVLQRVVWAHEPPILHVGRLTGLILCGQPQLLWIHGRQPDHVQKIWVCFCPPEPLVLQSLHQFFWGGPEPWGVGIVNVSSVDEHSTYTYSLDSDQLWVSALAASSGQRNFSIRSVILKFHTHTHLN